MNAVRRGVFARVVRSLCGLKAAGATVGGRYADVLVLEILL